MMHLIFKINGLPPYANRKAVKVVRTDQSGQEEEFEVNVDDRADDLDEAAVSRVSFAGAYGIRWLWQELGPPRTSQNAECRMQSAGPVRDF